MSNLDTIQKLREETGAGVMEAKRALEEAGGDAKKAAELLRAKGMEKAEKRADREAGAGLIHGYVHNGRVGVLVDLRAETDFVVNSDPFRELAKEIALQIAAMGGDTVDAVMEQPYIKDPSKTMKDLVQDVIRRTGENVKLHGFSRLGL
jgi:elongation factor Ts